MPLQLAVRGNHLHIRTLLGDHRIRSLLSLQVNPQTKVSFKKLCKPQGRVHRDAPLLVNNLMHS